MNTDLSNETPFCGSLDGQVNERSGSKRSRLLVLSQDCRGVPFLTLTFPLA